jgi:hypothetical protein
LEEFVVALKTGVGEMNDEEEERWNKTRTGIPEVPVSDPAFWHQQIDAIIPIESDATTVPAALIDIAASVKSTELAGLFRLRVGK